MVWVGRDFQDHLIPTSAVISVGTLLRLTEFGFLLKKFLKRQNKKNNKKPAI